MKKFILFIGCILNSGVYAQPAFLWAKQMVDGGYDSGWSIAVDSNGNVYTTGYFGGIVDFDPGVGTFNLTSAGGRDIFISKLDPSGGFIWAKRFGGATDDKGSGITVDKYGNVYTIGDFYGTVDFEPGVGIYNLSAAGSAGSDVFISKLNAAGNFVWAKQLGGGNSEVASAINVDNNGSIYTAGGFVGTADFDPGPGIYNLVSTGYDKIFVCKLDSAGNFTWAKQMGGMYGEFVWDMAIDDNHNVYTTGRFQGTADFDPGSGTYNLTCAGNWDIFISKLDSSGNFAWAKQIGSTDFDCGYSLAFDMSNNVFITGCFMATTDFDPGSGVYNLTSAGVNDIFITKLDYSGNFCWVKQMGGTSNDAGNALAVDDYGNIYIAGNFRSAPADFDPGLDNYILSCSGFNDFYLCKLDAKGNFICAGSMGGTGGSGMNECFAMALNANGDVYLTGQFASTACDFDPGSSTYNLSSTESYDIFITKLRGCTPGVINVSTDEIVSDNSVIIFPNPSSGIFTVNLISKTIDTKIFVYDVVGNCLWNKNCRNEANYQIDLRSHPKGIYLMEIVSEGKRFTKKIVLQ